MPCLLLPRAPCRMCAMVRGIPELFGIHLPKTFVALDFIVIVATDFEQNPVQLIVIVRVPYLFILLNLVKRRLGKIYITLLNQLRHKAGEAPLPCLENLRTVLTRTRKTVKYL